jgi:hypothetical protein
VLVGSGLRDRRSAASYNSLVIMETDRAMAEVRSCTLSVFPCVPSWFSLERPYEKSQFFGLQSLQVSHRL